LTIFDEKSRKLPQIGSGRISVTANDRPVEPKIKWPIFDDFYEKSRKLLQTGSGRISVTANDGPVEPKIKWPIFDDF
jgi:hypothetical protein